MLKHEEKEKHWKKDAELWVEEKGSFEARQAELERELKEMKKRDWEQPVPMVQSSEISSAEFVTQAMS